MTIVEAFRSKRLFSKSQKALLYVRAEGRCEKCRVPLGDTWEADHIIRFSDGGYTLLSNAQALCSPCHNQKTMLENQLDRSLRPTLNKKSPRKWQADALKAVEAARQLGETNHFCVDATPGAGKSLFLQLVARHLLESGLVDSVLVLVPTDELRRSAKTTFQESIGVKLIASSGHELAADIAQHYRQRDAAIADGAIGQIMTYSQSTNEELFNEALHDWSTNKRMLLIADEVHHAAEKADSKWGKALQTALYTCEYALLLTGTLFRSDMAKIPGVSYLPQGDQALLANPHYRLTLAQATQDNYVSTVNFVLRDAEVTFNNVCVNKEGETVNEVIKRALTDVPDGKEADQLYGLSLDPFQPAMKLLLTEAHNNVLYKRKRHFDRYQEGYKEPAPAGLVVCRDQAMADATAVVLQEITGKLPLVVHGNAGKNMVKRIAKFRKVEEHEWCVSVGMISEGVDIQRIKTIVFMTNKKTPLIFSQIVGRAQRVRYDNGGNLIEEMATVFMPYHPELDKYAHEFMTEQGISAFEIEEEEALKVAPTEGKSTDEALKLMLEKLKEDQKKEEQKRYRELIEAIGGQEINYLNGERVANSEFLQILLDLGTPLEKAQIALIEASKRGLLTV
jgi:superfamily II DNA or RNA helicase